MHKQPPECCRLLGYPAAIIASHYSWDLPFNPGHVIGLLSSIQAGLTPQTGIHSAAMQCYQQMQQTNRDRNTRPRRFDSLAERRKWRWNNTSFVHRPAWQQLRSATVCYMTPKKSSYMRLHVLVWVSWVGTERTQHKHSQDFKVALLHRTKQAIPVGRCVTHMWTDNHTHTRDDCLCGNVVMRHIYTVEMSCGSMCHRESLYMLTTNSVWKMDLAAMMSSILVIKLHS